MPRRSSHPSPSWLPCGRSCSFRARRPRTPSTAPGPRARAARSSRTPSTPTRHVARPDIARQPLRGLVGQLQLATARTTGRRARPGPARHGDEAQTPTSPIPGVVPAFRYSTAASAAIATAREYGAPTPGRIGSRRAIMQPGDRDEIQAIRAELEGLRTQVDAAARPPARHGGHGHGPAEARQATDPRRARGPDAGAAGDGQREPHSATCRRRTRSIPRSRGCSARASRPGVGHEVLPGRERDARPDGGLPESRSRPGAVDVAARPGSPTTGRPWTTMSSARSTSSTVAPRVAPACPGDGHRRGYTTRAGRVPCELRRLARQRGHRRGVARASRSSPDVPTPPDDAPTQRGTKGARPSRHLFTVPSGVTDTYAPGARR